MDYKAFLEELDNRLDKKLQDQHMQYVDELDKKISEEHNLIVTELSNKFEITLTNLSDKTDTLENTISKLKTDLDHQMEKLDAKLKVMQDMDNRMKSLEEDNSDMIRSISEFQEENDGLKSEILLLKVDMEKMKDEGLRNEQYMRKNNIKVYGMKESRNESCTDVFMKMVKDSLNIELKPSQIAIAHRIAGKEGRHRPILVRFEQHDVKYTVLKQRRRLKDSGISIQEDLTRLVWEKLAMVKIAVDCVDAWAWNGKIFIKDKDSKVHKVPFGSRIPDPFR